MSPERVARSECRAAEEKWRRHQRLCWYCYQMMPKPAPHCREGRDLHSYMQMWVAQVEILAAEQAAQADVKQEPLF